MPLTPQLAVAFVKEEVAGWPRGDYSFTVQALVEGLDADVDTCRVLVVWSKPSPAVPVPPVVVNMPVTVTVTESGPVMSVSCACWGWAACRACEGANPRAFECPLRPQLRGRVSGPAASLTTPCHIAVEIDQARFSAADAARVLVGSIERHMARKEGATAPLSTVLGLIEPFEKDRLS